MAYFLPIYLNVQWNIPKAEARHVVRGGVADTLDLIHSMLASSQPAPSLLLWVVWPPLPPTAPNVGPSSPGITWELVRNQTYWARTCSLTSAPSHVRSDGGETLVEPWRFALEGSVVPVKDSWTV